MALRQWTIYEITSQTEKLKDVKLRGTLRKFALSEEIELLTENATDQENTVRFAIEDTGRTSKKQKDKIEKIIKFLKEKFDNVEVKGVLAGVMNPVLSKLVVNDLSRYVS